VGTGGPCRDSVTSECVPYVIDRDGTLRCPATGSAGGRMDDCTHWEKTRGANETFVDGLTFAGSCSKCASIGTQLSWGSCRREVPGSGVFLCLPYDSSAGGTCVAGFDECKHSLGNGTTASED
jgi:hypothetical protein